MSGLSAISVQQEAQCVSLYHETDSITQSQRNFFSKHGENASARISTSKWLRTFQGKGSVESQVLSGKSEILNQR